MSSALPWIVGVIVLVVLGVLATEVGRRGHPEVTVDRARSLLSELELALDHRADEVTPDTLAEAQRLHLLAGGCLAGAPNADDARRSAELSERALRLLR